MVGEAAMTATTPPRVDLCALTRGGLTYGQVAWLLNVSDLPLTRPVGVREDPRAYLAQGRARFDDVALAEMLRVDAELVDRKYRDRDPRQRRAAAIAHNKLWGGARRFDRVHTLAERLWHSLPDDPTTPTG